VVGYLRVLLRKISGKIVLIWDGSPNLSLAYAHCAEIRLQLQPCMGSGANECTAKLIRYGAQNGCCQDERRVTRDDHIDRAHACLQAIRSPRIKRTREVDGAGIGMKVHLSLQRRLLRMDRARVGGEVRLSLQRRPLHMDRACARPYLDLTIHPLDLDCARVPWYLDLHGREA
jgi:hypothetical protein